MANIPFTFQVVNGSGNPVTGLAFASALAAPGFSALKTVPGLATITTYPTVFELGQGYYGFLYDAETGGEAFAIMDAGTTLTGAARYPGVPLTRDSTRIQGALTAGGATVGGYSAGQDPVALIRAATITHNPAVGTWDEALSYARAQGGYKVERPSANAIDFYSWDKTTLLFTLVFTPSLTAPTTVTPSR